MLGVMMGWVVVACGEAGDTVDVVVVGVVIFLLATLVGSVVVVAVPLSWYIRLSQPWSGCGWILEFVPKVIGWDGVRRVLCYW